MTSSAVPVVEDLYARRDVFHRFVRRHAPTVDADEVVQAAFAKASEKASELEDPERADAWFFRIIRNQIVDQVRRSATRSRAAEALAREPVDDLLMDVPSRPCACIRDELEALKVEYKDALQAVDLDERRVTEVAGELGITPNNAMVRLHRARQSLRRRVEARCGHCAGEGCRDCSCGEKAEV